MAGKKGYAIQVLIALTFFFICVTPARALEVRNYKITDAQTLPRRDRTSVLWHTNLSVPWKSGKVVISRYPDGTGSAQVGQVLRVEGPWASKQFTYESGCDQKPMPPLDITHLMGPRYVNGENQNTELRFSYSLNLCAPLQWELVDGRLRDVYDIDELYLVHFDDYEVTDAPFLDLPWDYREDGKTFAQAALGMSSFFDHEYPLLSTGINESPETSRSMIYYKNAERNNDLYYSSHDGYDWARLSGAVLDDPVLAAAGGKGKYHYDQWSGHAIFIDHMNSYQTRYYHLQPHDLVTRSSIPIDIADRQMVGRVGYTGNVRPQGEGGAHIHFMVVKDKDGDGAFEDNIPDGIMDPFGWQGEGADPWEIYSFSYKGVERTGVKSRYLWKTALTQRPSTLTSDGASIIHSATGTVFVFPKNGVLQDAIFYVDVLPPVSGPTIEGSIWEGFSSVGNIVEATLSDGFGGLITSLSKAFTLEMKFSPEDLGRYDSATLSIYSSTDGIDWVKEHTLIDLVKKKATSSIDHLTYFALMAEKLDILPPTSQVILDGMKTGEYYTSPVDITISATDTPEEHSLGVSYTAYRINDAPWSTYDIPLTISEEGIYTVEFYSEDGEGNIEDTQSISFVIDFDPPTPIPTDTPSIATLSADFATPSAEVSEPTPTPTFAPTIDPASTLTPTPVSHATDTPTPTPTRSLAYAPTSTLAPPIITPSKENSTASPQGEILGETEEVDPKGDASSLAQKSYSNNSFLKVILGIIISLVGGLFIRKGRGIFES